MKNLLNIILVSRTEIEDRWWHRLANILIYGTTICVLIGTTSVTIFNFKNPQRLSLKMFSDSSLTLTEIQTLDTSTGLKTSGTRLADGTIIIDGKPASLTDRITYSTQKIKEKETEERELRNTKLLINILMIIGFTIGWFIFWETIVYRSLIYIIYGHKN